MKNVYFCEIETIMESKIKIGFSQLFDAITQLSDSQKERIRVALNREKEHSSKNDTRAFQNFLLSAPTMDDQQFSEYLENRKNLNLWRTM